MTAHDILRKKLRQKQERNPRYSLRAFAKSLNVSPSTLNQILLGKRPLTEGVARRFATSGLFSAREVKTILKTCEIEKIARRTGPALPEYRVLEPETFDILSHWATGGLFSLMDLDDAAPGGSGIPAEPALIAKRLRITPTLARKALAALVERGFLVLEDGHYSPCQGPVTTTSGVPSAAIRAYHAGVLERAALSLHEDPLEERDFSAITMAADPDHLPLVRELTERYRREVCKLLESGSKRRVYTLAIQLFPLSEKLDAEPQEDLSSESRTGRPLALEKPAAADGDRL